MSNVNQDLQEIIDVVAEGVQTGIDKLSDGFQYLDLFSFIPVLSKIPTAIEGNENAWAYLKDMTEEKENAIVDAVAEKLGNASDFVKTSARRILRLLAEGYMTAIHFSKKSV